MDGLAGKTAVPSADLGVCTTSGRDPAAVFGYAASPGPGCNASSTRGGKTDSADSSPSASLAIEAFSPGGNSFHLGRTDDSAGISITPVIANTQIR